ncbi:metal-dependent hydrolase [compost metagenome]
MHIQQIRNATIIVQYAGKKFLIDPMLAEKGAYPPFGAGDGFPVALRQDQYNPLVNLPISLDEIIQDIDAVILTHLHLDHFDEAAKKVLPKETKMFVQNEEDAQEVQYAGFSNVEVLQADTIFAGIQLIKTKGEHGRGEILKITGHVCGVVFNHSTEKKLYVAGDTVWYDAVREVIDIHKPEVIVVNGGGNQFLEGGSIIMGKEDIYEVYIAAPKAKIISVHMEAVNHWALSRNELKSYLIEKRISSSVLVPDDGESYTL